VALDDAVVSTGPLQPLDAAVVAHEHDVAAVLTEQRELVGAPAGTARAEAVSRSRAPGTGIAHAGGTAHPGGAARAADAGRARRRRESAPPGAPERRDDEEDDDPLHGDRVSAGARL
jgi:hypothetical protein